MKDVILRLFFLSLLASPLLGADEVEEISPERYICGGITGTLCGFGIGHAIQGRYKNKGWIFTLSESLAIGTIISGVVVSSLSPELGSTSGHPDARAILTYAGVGIGLCALGGVAEAGFRIWEIVDVWWVDHARDHD